MKIVKMFCSCLTVCLTVGFFCFSFVAERGNLEMIDTLLQAGAAAAARDKYGHTAVLYAWKEDSKETAQFLRGFKPGNAK
jgi:hypothetical protein